jgi:hypothetical protein
MPAPATGTPGAVSEPERQRLAARKLRFVLLANLMMFTLAGLVIETGFRWFWHPRSWVESENWSVGSGEGSAGSKWWPNSTYRVEGREFLVRFQTNALGYRARPEPPRTANPIRIAFVGDSFTEAKQVDYDLSFVALLERALSSRAGREVVGENFGVAGTGFFEYWHRIIHDVFRADAPPFAGLVLCICASNDFTDHYPDDGFEPNGCPRREYFTGPTWAQHALVWLNLKSKAAHCAVQSLRLWSLGVRPPQLSAPGGWWCDPALAAAAGASPDVRHVRALMRAIEHECDRHGTRLVIVIVGPVNSYQPRGGPSPLAQIFRSWGIQAAVIDVAAQAMATAHPGRLVFFLDGHLNAAGHRYLADIALEPLSQALGFSGTATARREDGRNETTSR